MRSSPLVGGDILPVMTAPATLTAIGTQIALGGGLFYGVVKFFEHVDSILTTDTKFDIAVWLLSRKRLTPAPAFK